MDNFSDLNLPKSLLQAVDALGYNNTTPIQTASLPPMLSGQDIRAQARTGSGKTAAFGLALLAKLDPDSISLQTLVLCPTRELADQVSKVIRALARFIPNIKVLSLCGGVPIRHQLSSLSHEPHIAVGTPGRIKDLLDRRALKLNHVSTVVLDEADRMLDMGFLGVVEQILRPTPTYRNTWLFSATYPQEIDRLSQEFQRNPVEVTIEEGEAHSSIKQSFFAVEQDDKPTAIFDLLLHFQPESCLIFCNTKNDTHDLADLLRQHQIPALELHGDLEQRDRDEALLQFANGSCRIMVATDVAARGLDIKDLPLVIGFELPNDPDVYVHRIGRTGRAGASGRAQTLVAEREMHRASRIEEIHGEAVSWSKVPTSFVAETLPEPTMKTLMIEGGKKDKLRPGDILGALTGSAGLKSSAIGKIDLTPKRAYVAIERHQSRGAQNALRDGKIKGRKFRVRRL